MANCIPLCGQYFFNIEYLTILIPLIGGALGGLCRILWNGLKDEFNFPLHTYVVFVLIGSVAGLIAVHLLNPNGNFSQMITISTLAGLSGMSFLDSNSLARDNSEEVLNKKRTYKKIVGLSHENVPIEDFEKFIEHLNEQPIEDIEKNINILYDRIKGDGKDEEK